MPHYAQLLFDLPLPGPFTYAIPEKLMETVAVGKRVSVPFGQRKMTGFVIALTDEVSGDFAIKEIERVIDKVAVYGEGTIALAEWMASFYLCSHGQALSLMIPTGRAESKVAALDFADQVSFEPIETLSAEQQGAIDEINAGRSMMYYLYGVTGSGKSEVYLRAAEAVIKEGRSVIYLVPEITLTHQLSRMVSARFGNAVAILHSALTPSQRLKEWKKIQSGEARLAIGARSAIFAPFSDLGLIIIDEEHENSYKSGSTPRYHARQVAQYRAQSEGATLIMGSATPSLEAYRLMSEGDQVKPLRLKERVGGGVLPTTEVVDMRYERHMISRRLDQAIRETLDRKRQVILFLNRRGFSYFFHCNSCGYELLCPHCDVSLTYHKRSSAMVCHYCGYKTRPVSVCPSCKSVDVSYSGFGTEMVEDEIRSLYPTARIERLDTDSAQQKGHLSAVIDDFREGSIDILLGTQMVAKGLNFPLVDLVGIINADSGLNIPDFRSQERTFSLLVQVSGRAGRYSSEGRVIIQTYQSENPAIVHAVGGDIDGFYENELAVRKETGFPPYARLANLVLRGRRREVVEGAMHHLEEMLRSSARQLGVEVLVAAECPLEKIASNWRYHILVSSERGAAVHNLLHHVLSHYQAPSSVYLEIDLDPLQLL
ncbi:MAG TPA: primosomal protein N' [Sphaerochaeta sp.]|jgi:primosomal protein N' (replication factor Y)|nr:primosomal protein N' [Sphaerochaeta sp.]HPZ15290.1 primosomal protein N' [Sphaerochaeta sp.]